ncbi:MAG: AAA family ATPase [Oscillospiraceae bacterium]|nr:AAA family ATPase [Oscillospiraceae bacterium]
MKEIKLLRLKLEHFKACPSRTFEFNGRNASIYGANGSGKTTLYNALTWLLFDKVAGDDGTVMTAPDIKPNGDDGEIADHTAISSVEAAFSVDDGTVTLRREYKEVWEAKRGSAEKTMNGHTSLYYWNGVPVQQKDFKERLSATIASEDLFWSLSNVLWFVKGMNWQSRRAMLADVCGLQSDAEILSANAERFPGLAEAMSGLPLPDFRKKVDADKTKLGRARDAYPARLDEIRKTIHQYDETDFDALRSAREAKDAEIRAKTDKLSRLDNGTIIGEKRNELQDVRNRARTLELENQEYRQSQTPPPDNRRPELEKNLMERKGALSGAEVRAEDERDLIGRCEAQIEALRAECRAVNGELQKIKAETFTETNCPTCGQPLPPDALAQARQQFERDRKRRYDLTKKRKADLTARANEIKTMIAAAQKRLDEAVAAAEAEKGKIAELSAALDSLPAAQTRIVSDLSNYAADTAAYNRQIGALQAEIDKLQEESAASRNALTREIARLNAEKARLDEQIAGEKVLADYRTREAELLDSMANAAEEIATLEKWRDMVDEFTRFKAQAIEDSVNGHFRTVRFKLFQPQVNGGLKECCDAYVGGGRLDHGLNTGAEYNAGIDVIDALSSHYGIRVPLFVDGAESVSDLLPIDTQVIRLVVSRDDKQLRLEVI